MHLRNHYGVHAFIKALIEWGNQQKKEWFYLKMYLIRISIKKIESKKV